MSTLRTAALVSATALIGTLAVAPSAQAASLATVTVCSQGSHARLSASPNSGSIAVTFGVNGAPAGNTWVVAIADRGTLVYRGAKVADGNGSWSQSGTTADQRGWDVLTGWAADLSTGEVCFAMQTVPS